MQNKEPKILVDDLQPVEWPDNPSLEWCPPGHGDLYTALVTSGMLDELLERGYRYAFVSNSDNLGAVLDPRILAWMAREEIPFLMEVTDRTEADRKGGHIAQRPRRRATCCARPPRRPRRTSTRLQDIGRHRYFNTNNLWLDLQRAARRHARAGRRARAADDRQPQDRRPRRQVDARVFQLETAMGAAIGVFDGALPLRVPRQRFAPVKTTEDLLALRSDAYVLTDDARVELAPERDGRRRSSTSTTSTTSCCATSTSASPRAPPSLVECERLAVDGDVTFGARCRRARVGDGQRAARDRGRGRPRGLAPARPTQ